MPRVHQRVARKDYPKYGILKGQSHYHWVLKTGPRSSREFRQLTPPKGSQLTNSEYLGRVSDLCDDIDGCTDAESLRMLAEEFRTLGEEQDEKFNNMPDGLQQGDTGQLLEERSGNCSQAADEIESAADDLENALSEIDKRLEAWEAFRAVNPDYDADSEDGDPDDLPDEEEIDADDAEEKRGEALTEALEAAGAAAGNC